MLTSFLTGNAVQANTVADTVLDELGVSVWITGLVTAAVVALVILGGIRLQPDNPLRGKNEDELGLRFPDMSQPYNKMLNKLLKKIAKKEKIKLREGVYACVAGPNLETRAEYRFIKRIGADAVGMSTVPEVIVAVHSGIPCCAISVLTDDCDPDNLKPVKLSEIIAIASKAEPKLNKLFVELIKQL
jgi:purine-nucleoside phosphorylase